MEENQVNIVEFNTEEWEVVSAIDVTDYSLLTVGLLLFCPSDREQLGNGLGSSR